MIGRDDRLETVAERRRLWDHEAMAALRREDIDKLSVEERLRLVEEIWESIRENRDGPPLSEAQRTELNRSIQAYRAQPDAVKDLDEILADLHRRS